MSRDVTAVSYTHLDVYKRQDEMRTSYVKDESLKAKFIHTLENVEEESNPILVIATLK